MTGISTFAQDALPMLLDVAVKSLLTLALAAVAVICLRRASAATRHLIWFVGIVGLLVLPVFSLVLPHWEVRWITLAQAGATLRSAPAQFTAQNPGDVPGTSSETPNPLPAAGTPSPLPPSSAEVFAVAQEKSPWSFATYALLVWMAGALLALMPTVLGVVSLWHLERTSQKVAATAPLRLLQQLSLRLRLHRRVALLQSSSRRMPMTWGSFRPRLLLPSQAQDWPAERCRVVLLHELAHVKRWDYLTNLITQFACALYWFNPLVWMAARQMLAERERACDDLVLNHGAPPAAYAEEILQAASGLRVAPLAAFSAIAMARPSHLEGRLVAILDARRNRGAISRAMLLGALASMFLLIVPAAMLRAAPEKPPAADSAGDDTANVVRVVVDKGRLTFEGQPATRADIERSVAKLPHREQIVLEIAAASGDVTIREFIQAREFAAELVDRFALKSLSDVGLQTFARGEVPAVTRDAQLATSSKNGFAEMNTLILSSRGRNRVLNLEDGKTYSSLPTNTPMAYLEKFPDGEWRFVIKNFYNYHTSREDGMRRWQTMTAAEIAEPAGLAAVPFERNGTYVLHPADMPVTILLPEWGLMQISGSDPRTTSVVLQYKRVDTGAKSERSTAPSDSGERRRAALSDDAAHLRLDHAKMQLARTEELFAQKLVSTGELSLARFNVALRQAELSGDAKEVARAQWQKARVDFLRAEELFREKLISEGEFRQARMEFDLRQAELTALERRYTTRRGDTLESIAAANRVTVKALREANPGVNWNRLQVGQPLLIPR